MIYAGEEIGLLGSQDIANQYKNDRKEVVGVMQFDMTMFSTENPVINLISDHTDPRLTEFTKKIIDEYIKIPVSLDKCGYACSDHASWTRYGYASVYPFETRVSQYNRKIHTPEDLSNILSFVHGVHFAKLGVAFAIELSKIDY